MVAQDFNVSFGWVEIDRFRAHWPAGLAYLVNSSLNGTMSKKNIDNTIKSEILKSVCKCLYIIPHII